MGRDQSRTPRPAPSGPARNGKRGSRPTKALGMTASGRILAVVFTISGDAIRPIYRIYRAERRMKEKRKIPRFKPETDEAAWWYAHREETARWMEEAAATGQTTTLSEVLLRARQRAGTTPTVSIRIAPKDIARARGLAEKKGLRYQTYLKMLLHEALEREQKRMAG